METEPKILLRDPSIEPSDKMLEDVLGKELFAIYRQITEFASQQEIECVWRFYNDGKAWLCKAVFKKKTVFWLSIWDGLIKTSFYFTEKTRAGVGALPISLQEKESFAKAAPTGKLIPLILSIESERQLEDFRQIVQYKKTLK